MLLRHNECQKSNLQCDMSLTLCLKSDTVCGPIIWLENDTLKTLLIICENPCLFSQLCKYILEKPCFNVALFSSISFNI